jgi:hypothetical protein
MGAKVRCQFFTALGAGTMESLPIGIQRGLTYLQSVGGMDPLTRDQMRGMCEAAIEAQKKSYADTVIREIYQKARIAATNSEKKYTHIQRALVGRMTVGAEQRDIVFDSVRDYIMSELERLFPGCKVEYVERRPDVTFAALDQRRRPAPLPGSDGVDRAIVVDWS